jgi:hypothetical protein
VAANELTDEFISRSKAILKMATKKEVFDKNQLKELKEIIAP